MQTSLKDKVAPLATTLMVCAFASSSMFFGEADPKALYMPGVFMWFALLLTIIVRLRSRMTVFDRSWFRSPIVVCLLILYVLGVASFVYLDWARAIALRAYWLKVSMSFAFVLLPVYIFSHLPGKPSQLRTVLLSFVAVGTFISCVQLAEILRGSIESGAARTVFGMHKNFLGDVSAVTAIICMAVFLSNTYPRAKYLFLIPTLIALFSSFSANARASTLSVPIAVALMSLLHGRTKLLSKTATLLLTVLMIGGFFMFAPQEKQERLLDTSTGTSAAARPLYWKLSVDYIQSKPLTPVGWGSKARAEQRQIDNPCNLFLETWIQLGPLAVLVQLALYVFLAVTIVQTVPRFGSHALPACIALAATGIILERFIRDMQDMYDFGTTLGVSCYAAIGMLLFLKSGIDKGVLTKLRKSPDA